MAAVEVQITPGGRARRIEVAIRIIYGLVLAIFAEIMGIIVAILWIVNFLTCLVLAKRVGAGFLAKYVAWIAKISAYILFITDERPPLLPF